MIGGGEFGISKLEVGSEREGVIERGGFSKNSCAPRRDLSERTRWGVIVPQGDTGSLRHQKVPHIPGRRVTRLPQLSLPEQPGYKRKFSLLFSC